MQALCVKVLRGVAQTSMHAEDAEAFAEVDIYVTALWTSGCAVS